jgi:hypothetical protein
VVVVVSESEEAVEEQQDRKVVIELRSLQLPFKGLFRQLLRTPLKVHLHQHDKQTLNVVVEVAAEGEMQETAREVVAVEASRLLTWQAREPSEAT